MKIEIIGARVTECIHSAYLGKTGQKARLANKWKSNIQATNQKDLTLLFKNSKNPFQLRAVTDVSKVGIATTIVMYFEKVYNTTKTSQAACISNKTSNIYNNTLEWNCSNAESNE